MKALLGISVLGVACCAGLPLMAAALAGAGAGALLGGVAGALALGVAAGAAMLVVRRRRRTGCAPTRRIGEP
jgi:hypothetical protein